MDAPITEFICPVDFRPANGPDIRTEVLWRRSRVIQELFQPHFRDLTTGAWKEAIIQRLPSEPDWAPRGPSARGKLIFSGTAIDAVIEACAVDGSLPAAESLPQLGLPTGDGWLHARLCEMDPDWDDDTGGATQIFLKGLHERDIAPHVAFGRAWAESQALALGLPEPGPAGPAPRI